jgi:hypothetical protein
MLSFQHNIYASWYGCAEYKAKDLEKMSEHELRDVYDKNVKLSDQIYEDAAVQSIFDKRIYNFRSQQYLDCIKYRKEIELVIHKRFSETIPGKK